MEKTKNKDVFGDNVEVLNTTTTADETIQKAKKKEENKGTFNPMTISLETLSVKDKTTENYYSQIKTNLYCSVKSHFLIARDLFEAKTNLSSVDFGSLVGQLKFTGTTQSKYLSIGKDLRMWNLFTKGVLPFKWTSQYFLTTLTDKQFDIVAESIDADMTLGKIKKLAGVGKAEIDRFDHLLQILGLEVEPDSFKDVSSFEKLLDKVTSVMGKYLPEITINTDKYEKAVEKVEKRCAIKEEKKHNLATAQNILRNASTINTASA